MPELSSRSIAETPGLRVRDVRCTAARGRHAGAEECGTHSHLVIPYRGAFVRRLGARQALADANQVLFFNAEEGYRIDHPFDGGDACLALDLSLPWLEALPASAVRLSDVARFSESQRSITPQVQLIASRLRHAGAVDVAWIEHLVARLLRELSGSQPRRGRRSTARHARIVARAKVLLHEQPAHRWSLGELAARLAVGPVHLTQVFSEVEGVPLYRYQTRLRLARALADLPASTDLSRLALDHGFSSHSQLTSAFVRHYGVTPSACRAQMQSART